VKFKCFFFEKNITKLPTDSRAVVVHPDLTRKTLNNPPKHSSHVDWVKRSLIKAREEYQRFIKVYQNLAYTYQMGLYKKKQMFLLLLPWLQDNMKEVRLKRQLGLLHGISIAAGLLIGAGIFITPQGVILHAGSAGLSLVLWAVGGAVAILGALTYAEIGIVIPQSGSLYACMRVMYGRFAGFIYLWSYLFFVRAGFDTIKCLLFGRYVLKPLFPDCVIPDVGVKLVATAIACKSASQTATLLSRDGH